MRCATVAGAVGGAVEVLLEDGALGDRALQAPGVDHLAQLAGQAARVRVHQADQLHGQRRGARDDAAVTHKLTSRARQGARIDAAVGAEIAILEGEQHGEIALVDVAHRHRQPPAIVRSGEGTQQRAVPVDDDGGKVFGHKEWWRPELAFGNSDAGIGRDGRDRSDRYGCCCPAVQRA